MPSRPDPPLAPAVVRADIDHGRAELVGDPERPLAWTLLVNGTAQSHVDLADPEHLEFEYVRRMGHVVDTIAPPTEPLRAVHLGGGAWTLPRYVAATRPASPQLVVELDAALIDLVAARLPADGTGIDVTSGDARARLATLPASSADLLVLDVFAGARTPAHLTSTEFVADVRRVLAPGGVYVANVADGGPLDFARGQIATVGAHFPELAVVAAPDLLSGRRFGNLVLVASDRPLPVADLTRRAAGDPFRARVLAGPAAATLARGAAVRHDRSTTPSPVPPPGFFGQ
ncbi:fused MFS/spermidine synthase [Pseudonocardia sp. RS11V-5]|uniref:spermidine synthase n=1 Tax=Pseudonocardia terrae TaxID=2905831 RepID=UPI001E56FE68|nr:fused MFS/spermidine synthase [Pseudonocardia terrae]MCE3553370.1 fused MFS/spermidine synthase [Pseudonocardia terrae]